MIIISDLVLTKGRKVQSVSIIRCVLPFLSLSLMNSKTEKVIVAQIQMELTFRKLTEEEENPPDDFLHLSISSKKGKQVEREAQKERDRQPEPERRKVVMSKPLDIFSVRFFVSSHSLK